MPKTKKAKEQYYFNCPHCEVKFQNYDEMVAHIDLDHATIYVKAGRGDYVPKLPYGTGSSDVSKAQREAYHVEQRRLNAQFQRDLEVEHGVQDNPKKDKLFDIAWSQGHSAGWQEVALHYEELVVLIQEVNHGC